MIQRVQSFYLLVAAGIGTFQLFIPFMKFSLPGEELCVLTGLGLFRAGLWYLGLLLLAMIVLSITAFLLFKNRPLQLKVTHGAAFCGAACALGALLHLFYENVEMCAGGKADYAGSGGLAMMPLAIFALLLASRGIRKDEELVRSADRIR